MAIKPNYMKITYSCTVLSQFAYGMTYLQCTKIVTPLFAVIVKLKCELFLHLISKCVHIISLNRFYILFFFSLQVRLNPLVIICATGQTISSIIYAIKVGFLSLPRIYQMAACRIFYEKCYHA